MIKITRMVSRNTSGTFLVKLNYLTWSALGNKVTLPFRPLCLLFFVSKGVHLTLLSSWFPSGRGFKSPSLVGIVG